MINIINIKYIDGRSVGNTSNRSLVIVVAAVEMIRATVLRKYWHNLLNDVDNFNISLFKLATKLEKIALNDEYFIKRKLYPNVDFYSGIILKALGLPESMFTVIFAVARTVGWISQWKEMTESENRISRPRQLYNGKDNREFVKINDRKNIQKMFPIQVH